MNHLTEKVWKVDTVRQKSNQFSFLKMEILDLRKEINELKEFFLNKIHSLETENALLKIRLEYKETEEEQTDVSDYLSF